MKITMVTSKFQELVNKSIKGSSNNKMIPITGLMSIELKDNVLILTTTDAANTLRVIENKVEGSDFYIVVQSDLFSKLIAKTTSEKITLKLKENSLEVKGNGIYNIELPLDEEGDLIIFPNIDTDFNDVKKTKVNLSTIKTILLSNKAALAETMEIPCLTGYLNTKEGVITTDTFKVCHNGNAISKDKILFTSEMINLFSVFNTEHIDMQRTDNTILFSTPGVEIFGYELDEIEEYPLEAIKGFLEVDFPSSCKLPKAAILSVLDRLGLFISTYQTNGVYLTFEKKGIRLSTPKSKGSELINFQSSIDFSEYSCLIDIELLRSQINAVSEDMIEMYYGNPKAIKIISGKITQVIALLEDGNDMEENSQQEEDEE